MHSQFRYKTVLPYVHTYWNELYEKRFTRVVIQLSYWVISIIYCLFLNIQFNRPIWQYSGIVKDGRERKSRARGRHFEKLKIENRKKIKNFTIECFGVIKEWMITHSFSNHSFDSTNQNSSYQMKNLNWFKTLAY